MTTPFDPFSPQPPAPSQSDGLLARTAAALTRAALDQQARDQARIGPTPPEPIDHLGLLIRPGHLLAPPQPAATPAISVSVSGGLIALTPGQSIQRTVSIIRTNYTDTVTPSLPGLPAGVTVSFSPPTFTGATLSSTMTVTAANDAASASATLALQAAGTGITTATTPVNVVVTGSAFGSPGDRTNYPVGTEPLAFTPPAGIDVYGNGTVFDADAAVTATLAAVTAANGWKFVEDAPYNGDIQAALNALTRGQGLVLENSGTKSYTGNFTIPYKAGTEYIPIISRGVYNREMSLANPMKARKKRVKAADLPQMAVVQGALAAPNATLPIFQTAQVDNVGYYIFLGIKVQPNAANTTLVPAGLGGNGHLLDLGLFVLMDMRQLNVAGRPRNFIIQQCWMDGTKTRGVRRGVLVGGQRIAIDDSLITEIHSASGEASGIGGWSCIDRVRVLNCRIEASAQSILYGGADPSVTQLAEDPIEAQIKNLETRGTYGTRPLWWHSSHPEYATTGPGYTWAYPSKTDYEHKNGSEALVEGCVFDNVWNGGQSGHAVLFQPLSDLNRNYPWVRIQNISFRFCKIAESMGGINILGGPAYNNNRPFATAVDIATGIIHMPGHGFSAGDKVVSIIARTRPTFAGTSGMTSSQTSYTLPTGWGAYMPPTPFNAEIYNSTVGVSDPTREVVTVTARAGDVITMTRGASGTAAVAHNTSGVTYAFHVEQPFNVTGISGERAITVIDADHYKINDAVWSGTYVTSNPGSSGRAASDQTAVYYNGLGFKSAGAVVNLSSRQEYKHLLLFNVGQHPVTLASSSGNRAYNFGGTVKDIIFDHHTHALETGRTTGYTFWLSNVAGAGSGFRVTNSILTASNAGYPVFSADNMGVNGTGALNNWTTGWVYSGNVIYETTGGNPTASSGGFNTFVSSRTAVGFLSLTPGSSNFRLDPAHANADNGLGAVNGVGGETPGVDFDQLDAYLAATVD